MRLFLITIQHFKSFFYFNPCIIKAIGRYFMVSLGKICELEILSKSDQSLVLDGAELESYGYLSARHLTIPKLVC